MKTKLITALRQAADAIEEGAFPYDFEKCQLCNCGSVICSLKGISPKELNAVIPKIGRRAEWSERAGELCPISGMPTETLFAELYGYGLTPRDIVHLENLSDPRVLVRMETRTLRRNHWFFRLFGIEPVVETTPAKLNRDHPKHAVAYMRAWAGLLEEEEPLTPEESARLQKQIEDMRPARVGAGRGNTSLIG